MVLSTLCCLIRDYCICYARAVFHSITTKANSKRNAHFVANERVIAYKVLNYS